MVLPVVLVLVSVLVVIVVVMVVAAAWMYSVTLIRTEQGNPVNGKLSTIEKRVYYRTSFLAYSIVNINKSMS